MESAAMVCELRVDTQSPGWQKTLMLILKSIQGLSYTIDAERGIARLSGKIDPEKLMLMLAKSGKHADLLWVDSGNHSTSSANVTTATTTTTTPVVYGNGYYAGHYSDHAYNPYGRMPIYSYPQYPDYSHYYLNHYQDYPSYYEPPARYFPQAPPPEKNPRLEPSCNLM